MTQAKTILKENESSQVIPIELSLCSLKAYENSTKKRTRFGRGNASGKGGECGRGHKGQKSRSGFSRKRGFEGGQNPLYKRIPKKRGFTNISRVHYVNINISNLNFSRFENSIDLKRLVELNYIGKRDRVKFVGNVPENFNLKSIEAHSVSKQLGEKLEKLGCIVIKP
jgi:large subunit ribosomal protein L15